MKKLSLKIPVLIATIALLLPTAPVLHAQALLLQLQAANYDQTTGTWTATVGSDAVQTNASFRSTLIGGLTPNGSSAVRFDGINDRFTLTTAVPAGNEYTAFAYLRPNDISGHNGGTIFAGATGSFHYRISEESQSVVRQSQQELGSGTTTLSLTNYSSINTTVSSTTGGTFRLNGVPDGTSISSTFTSPITTIGAHSGGGELFSGDIVEIRIYSGIMTDLQRLAVENEFNASYVLAAIPEPGTYALMMGSCGLLAVFVRRNYSRKA